MSKVVVVSEGHIKNTKVIIDGEKKEIESLQYEITKWNQVGILTISVVDGKSPLTYAFNDEEDEIIFHLDWDIEGEPIAEKENLTIMEWQAKYNKQ
jgi:hypothetical protein